MTNLEQALEELREEILNMMTILQKQLVKVKDSLFQFDLDLAQEVVNGDKRIDAIELNIDKECHQILALYNPVAVDLRNVMATLKTNHDLERVGDNISGIAKLVIKTNTKIDEKILEEYQVLKMITTTILMLDNMAEAIAKQDTSLARRIYKKDRFLDENDERAWGLTLKLLKKEPKNTPQLLCVFSIIRKLERVGDLVKNLAEEMIYHIEAKVMKHRDLKKE